LLLRNFTEEETDSATITATGMVVVKPFINLKKLELRPFSPSRNNDIEFLTNKFPSVSDFFWLISNCNWLESGSKITAAAVLDFFKYLREVKKHHLYIFIMKNSRSWPNIFEHYYQNEENRNNTIEFILHNSISHGRSVVIKNHQLSFTWLFCNRLCSLH
jgi:hypothetical protein